MLSRWPGRKGRVLSIVTSSSQRTAGNPREHVGRRANRRESSKQEAVVSGLATAWQPMPKGAKEPGLTGGRLVTWMTAALAQYWAERAGWVREQVAGEQQETVRTDSCLGKRGKQES